MKRSLFSSGWAALTLLLAAGCATNLYEKHYSTPDGAEYIRSEEPVKLLELVDPAQIAALQSTGDYVHIGTSSFYGLWHPRTFALECAEKHGAALVVVAWQTGDTKKKAVTYHVATQETAYQPAVMYGPYGEATVFYTPVAVQSSRPVTVNYENTYYHQHAYFFGIRKYREPFGVYFHLPRATPGKPGEVRVAVVVPGSPAEKQGIKPGDRVKRVNGREINGPNDVRNFLTGKEQIATIEVTHE